MTVCKHYINGDCILNCPDSIPECESKGNKEECMYNTTPTQHHTYNKEDSNMRDTIRMISGIALTICLLPLAGFYWIMLIPLYLFLPVWVIVSHIFNMREILDGVIKVITFPLDVIDNIIVSCV